MNENFLKLINNPLRFKLFMLTKLPAAYFSGLRLNEANAQQCTVTVPYKWLTRNPFGSTYFASLAMAAEMSTGVLALGYIYKSNPAVSMLVVGLTATYHKKAVGITSFTCSDGAAFSEAIKKAKEEKISTTVISKSIGVNNASEKVAEFEITWSFREKASK